MRIYVGNLSNDVTESDLQTAFGAYGKVEWVQVVVDRDTKRSRGFGFVEMPSVSEAQAAIAGLNGKALKGRAIIVDPARPRPW